MNTAKFAEVEGVLEKPVGNTWWARYKHAIKYAFHVITHPFD